MTITKRLFWSNILMLLVPVVITGLIGLLCIGFMWLTLLNGAGLRLRGPEDFDRVSRGVTELAEFCIDHRTGFSSLDALLDSSGLGLWADDCIEKPFSPSVLVARVKANLAQYRRLSGKNKTPSEISLGGIRINPGTHRVFVDGNEVELKNKEYELLLFLMLNADLVFDRETLYEKVWGMDAMGDNATVAVHINRLREKIEQDPAKPRHIETVRGAGYRFRR